MEIERIELSQLKSSSFTDYPDSPTSAYFQAVGIRFELISHVNDYGLANRYSTIMFNPPSGSNRSLTCTAVTPSPFSKRISPIYCVLPCSREEGRTPNPQRHLILSQTCIPIPSLDCSTPDRQRSCTPEGLVPKTSVSTNSTTRVKTKIPNLLKVRDLV